MAQSDKLKKYKEDRKKIQDTYRQVFGTPQGQRLLEDLKKSVGHGQTLYQENSSNSDLAFHLGRQSLINDIVNFMNQEISPEE